MKVAKEKLRELIKKSKVADTLVSSYDSRTVALSAVSFIAAIAFAVFNTSVYAVTMSPWCGTMAFYHIMLVLLRGYVLRNHRKINRNAALSEEKRLLMEVRQYRTCGIVFVLLTFCLTAMIIHIVREDKVFDYEMYVIYTIAGFTLFQITVAVVNYIKTRKSKSYTVRSLRCINLTTALVSFISLQAIALDTFSHNINVTNGNALTGLVVCFLVAANGAHMIIHATIKINEIKAKRQPN